MADTTFYVRGKSKGNERKVILQTAVLLIGKAPAKQKRIKIKVKMPLSGRTKMAGTPDWISNALTFVSQSHDTVTPNIEFGGFDIIFCADTLFQRGANAVKSDMKSFVIAEEGESENPDVAMSFVIYTPFSTGLWAYIGQMAGDEIWAKFEQGAVEEEPESEEEELSGDEEEGELEDEETGDEATA